MHYLANENLPLKTIKDLKEDGIDILSVKEILPGAGDEEVLSISIKENRILITFDKDFGEWVFRQKVSPKGIILLRFLPKSVDYITSELRMLLKKDISFQGHFTVVDEKKIRVVPL